MRRGLCDGAGDCGSEPARRLQLAFLSGQKQAGGGGLPCGLEGHAIRHCGYGGGENGKLGILPEEILVGVGPSICGPCYEVQEDVAALFRPEYPGLC